MSATAQESRDDAVFVSDAAAFTGSGLRFTAPE
jgi:hypothetical protein